jgi:hypothetical protein
MIGKNEIQSIFISILIFAGYSHIPLAGEKPLQVSFEKRGNSFVIASRGNVCRIWVSSDDFPGVKRTANDLQSDIESVTGLKPTIIFDNPVGSRDLIIAGTIGHSPLIDTLVKRGKIQVDDISGKWESFVIQTIDKPFKGVGKALVIAGSDKRGTIYGIYEISRAIGVSPWYWWSDVVPMHHDKVFVPAGRYVQGEPSVKYRGIFLNDEAPALTNWVAWKYGMVKPSEKPPVPAGVANYGHEFYSRIFELLLRLKGNYLWPAMWSNAFNEDDTLNPHLADEYGIVMGTSHQEPMLRAQQEWDRRYRQTLGHWNYSKHAEILHDFWREGIRRNRSFESIITMGLRGADDTEMAPGGPEANIKVLEGIIDVQRKILAEEVDPDVSKVPQLWCLYKEIQDYYNAGLRVPDDITLLWAEDNWGNIRRLPTKDERNRSGGSGIYYHFDYHGGPRSYQWINTNPVSKIWDQMSLAKEYGADRIWIVNVGHFKGYELPLEYFLSMSWDTDRFNGHNIGEFTEKWAAEQFGKTYARDIAFILSSYTRFNGRRKPELLSPFTYSLTDYHEAEKVVDDYKYLVGKAEEINAELPAGLRDAYYQLVLFPVKASALVNELYYAAGKNALYASQGRAATNDMADTVEALFKADTSLMGYYNHKFAGGKWNHFMDQTHLGYLSWNDPPINSLRALSLKRISLPEKAEMSIAIEGSTETWPGSSQKAVLPEIDNFSMRERYIDIFNKGREQFSYSCQTDKPWILLYRRNGIVDKETRLQVLIDWSSVPEGRNEGNITIRGAGGETSVGLIAFKRSGPENEKFSGYIESEGCVSIEAEHYSKKSDCKNSCWEKIEGYGKTLSAMRATNMPDSAPLTPGVNSPCLEYDMYMFDSDTVSVKLTMSPSLNFMPGKDVRIGVSFDEQTPQIVTVVPGDYNAQNGNHDWEKSVADNARYISTKHILSHRGKHTLKIWMTDQGVVLEKIVVDAGGVKPSYLGPPESVNFNSEVLVGW